MTESQIKQFGIQQQELEKKCEALSRLSAEIRGVKRSCDKNVSAESDLRCVVSALYDIDKTEITDFILNYAVSVESKLKSEIENISLLDILSQIEKG